MLLGRALIGNTSCHGEIAGERFHVLEGDIFGDYRRNGQSMPMSDVMLGTPIDGVRFINVMGGFLKPGQARTPEMFPMWLPKACNFASGDHGEIQALDDTTMEMVIESELAVVIRQPLRKASPDEARAAILGFSVCNDVTASQYGEYGFWAVGKSIDGFASWGPWIRTDLTEARVMEGLAITARINGTQVQSGTTSLFRFTPSEMLSHVSHRISLAPGDVVMLGTPPPPPPVKIGDHVECEVEEIGVLNNYIVKGSVEPPSAMPRRHNA